MCSSFENNAVSDESQAGIEDDDGLIGKRKKKKSGDNRGRNFAFLVYEDSAYPDWKERLDALHVRGFISPAHDKDFNADGSPKKKHWHVLLFFDGKKSKSQIIELVKNNVSENFNGHFEEIHCIGAYSRYLCHMDNPEKAQYNRNDVISLGGADYELASVMPGDDDVVLCDISEYIVEYNVTFLPALIKACKNEGRRDWINYISRRGYLINAIITQNVKRLKRIKYNDALPGDTVIDGDFV